MKKTLFIVISIWTLFFGTNIYSAQDQSFSDLPSSNRNFDAIEFVKDEGIVQGYSDGTFKPYSDIKRAEYTKILVEAEFDDATINGCLTDEQKQAEHPFFSDINKGDWFIPYVCVAVKNGLIGGYPDGTFKPADTIAFVESAKIIVNAFEPGKVKVSDDIWFKDYVKKLANERHAVPGTILDFDQKMLRGEVAEMIYRVKEDIKDKESPSFEDLNCPRGDITIPVNSTVEKVCVKEGNVIIEANVNVTGDITVVKGNLDIDNNVIIEGSIKMIEKGNLTIGSNLSVKGDIRIELGDISFGVNSEFGGKVEALQGNIKIDSNITAKKGISAIRGSITIAGNADVSNGDIEALNNIDISSNPTVKNIISSEGAITLSSGATVSEDVLSMKDIISDGSLSATNVISFDGDVQIGSNSEVSKIISANNGSVSLDSGSKAETVYTKNGFTPGANIEVLNLYGEVKEEGLNSTIEKVIPFSTYDVMFVQEKALVNSEQKSEDQNTEDLDSSIDSVQQCSKEDENVYDMDSKGPTSCCSGLSLKSCEGTCTPSILGKCIKNEGTDNIKIEDTNNTN